MKEMIYAFEKLVKIGDPPLYEGFYFENIELLYLFKEKKTTTKDGNIWL